MPNTSGLRISLAKGRDIRFYRLALKVASRSDCKDKHGTVIVRGGSVIGVATNRFIGHRVSSKWLKKTLHSEQRALILSSRSCNGAILYTARLNARNPTSIPCVMCMALCIDAGIKKVVCNDGKFVVTIKL